MELSPLTIKDLSAASTLVIASSPALKFANPSVLKRQFFEDPDTDSSFLLKATDKKKMLGIAVGIARVQGQQKAGFIKYFGVAPKFRRKGAGQALVSELERRFQKRDLRELSVGGLPSPYLLGGAEVNDTATVSFLMKRGYQRSGEIIDMTAPLGKWKPQVESGDAAVIKEFGIRRAQLKDSQLLADFARDNFPGWASEINAGLSEGAVFLAVDGGRCVAFCCGNGINPGFLGPMGTAETHRGKGLARILLNRTLEYMKKSGEKSARIPSVGPIPFYARYAGATLGPLFWRYSKKL